MTSFVGDATDPSHPASDVVLSWAYDTADIYWQSTSSTQNAAQIWVGNSCKPPNAQYKLSVNSVMLRYVLSVDLLSYTWYHAVSYLQIDLLDVHLITRILRMTPTSSSNRMTSLRMSYSLDDDLWTQYWKSYTTFDDNVKYVYTVFKYLSIQIFLLFNEVLRA